MYDLFADYSDFDYTPLHEYSDTSGVSDLDDHYSISEYIYFYYNASISWGSCK